MKRSFLVWLTFALCAAVVFAALGWISLAVLRLDEAEAESRRQAARAWGQVAMMRHQAAVDENTRLALWRMDTALAPILAQESARPVWAYRAFVPADRAGGASGGGKAARDERLIPSPLLSQTGPYTLVYFQVEPDGTLNSPRLPTGDQASLAVPKYLSAASVAATQRQLESLRGVLTNRTNWGRLPESRAAPVEVVALAPPEPQQRFAGQQQAESQLAQQASRGVVEYNLRTQRITQNTAAIVQGFNTLDMADGIPLASMEVEGGLMTPLWLDGRLVLARRVRWEDRQCIQGCVLDWEAMRPTLLASIGDLLPKAELRPLAAVRPETEAVRLAALPLELVPGPIEVPALPADIDPARFERTENGTISPARLTLLLAWTGVILAAAAIAALLWGVLRLSARRAAFVSAVTHELRTPLTTFHLYTEMLAEGMVRDPEQQRTYLETLRLEASRLTHLVENVLAYARLERGRRPGRVETVTLGQLIDQARPQLADRAARAGMELVVEAEEADRAAAVRANPSAVEQILLNLVDNAAKYAAAATDRQIHVTLSAGGRPELRVRDHGPGVANGAERRLFQLFAKSARDAAHSAPGVGLGLALSRRLARDMGARLRLDRGVSDGACFVLTLARAG